MESEYIQLTREELYNKVWGKPLLLLAKDLGISDRGLAKLCKRHLIPIPGLGYWSKFKVGEKLRQKRLPTIKSSDTHLNNQIVFRYKKPSIISLPVIDEIQKAIEDEKNLTDRTPSDLTKELLHPVTLKLQKSISEKSDKLGHLKAKRGKLNALIVTRSSLLRANQILDQFLFYIEAKGHTVEFVKNDSIEIKVSIYNETCLIRIIEEIKTVEQNQLSDKTIQIKSKWNYCPTGKLKLEAQLGNVKHSVSDTKELNLEHRFQTLMIKLYNKVIQLKILREEYAQEERRLEEQHRKWREEYRLEQLYKKRVEIIKVTQQKWAQIQDLREFYLALQSSIELHQGNKEQFIILLNWLSDYIKINDPLNALDSLVESFEQD